MSIIGGFGRELRARKFNDVFVAIGRKISFGSPVFHVLLGACEKSDESVSIGREGG
jgi:hypothetical protein